MTELIAEEPVQRNKIEERETPPLHLEVADGLRPDVQYRASQNMSSEVTNSLSEKTFHSIPKNNEESLSGLDLRTAALYQTRNNFERIDTSKDARLQKQELTDYAKESSTSPMQRAFINNQLLPNYEQMSNVSRDRFGSSIMRDSELRKTDLETAIRGANALNHLYEKDGSGNSLYGRLADKDGNLRNIETLRGDPKTSRADKQTLDFLHDETANFAPWGTMSASRLKDVSDRFKPTAPQSPELAQSTSEKSTEAGDKNAAAQKLEKPPIPNSDLLDLATVRKGEGPFHSAERMLAANGHKASMDEVRSLVKAMKTMYAAEGHGDLKDLKVKHKFVTPENFEKLLSTVDNPKAKEALLRFIKK